MNLELRNVVESIFSKDCSPQEVWELKKLLHNLLPNFIYKFRELNEYAIINLCEQTLWFDSPLNMNDPYDSRHTYESVIESLEFNEDIYNMILKYKEANIDTTIKNQVRNLSPIELCIEAFPNNPAFKIMEEIFRDRHKEMLKATNKNLLKNIVICSFSESYSPILMWTHYTKNHTGFCIEYNLKNLNPENPFKNSIYPIIYDQDLFDITDFLKINSKEIKNHLYMLQSIFRKSHDWSYEEEWRVVHPFGTVPSPRSLRTPEPSSILLGSRFFKQFENISSDQTTNIAFELATKLIKHSEKLMIPLYLMHHSSSKFEMEKTEISYKQAFDFVNIR